MIQHPDKRKSTHVTSEPRKTKRQTRHTLAGVARYLDTPGGLDFLRENAPELLQRPGTREFIEQNYPELADQAYPSGGLGASERFNTRQRILSGQPAFGAQLTAPVDAQEAGVVADVFADLPPTDEQVAQVEENAERIIEADTELNNSLLQNALQRAQFDLGLSTDEEDFEVNRQTLITATNTYYDAELERINGLMASEMELQNLREDNALAREKALQRATTATNTFAEARIQGEMDAAEAAARTAAEQERALQRQTAAQERETERQMREAERMAEQERRETERAEAEVQREAERQQREAEQQAGRESAAGAGLLQTGVRRAQFGLGFATDEADFESRRQTLITATNDYYDNEETRINGLMQSEIELANLRAKNALDREVALQRVADTENPFEQQRLQNAAEAEREAERAAATAQREAEQQAAQEQRELERQQREQTRTAERAERERLRAAERAQREQQRLLERQQREEQRAIEQRIRQEMRLQDEIDGLREDAFEAEQDRQQALIDLEQDNARRREEIEEEHQERLQDIRRSAAQSEIEAGIEFQRDLQDLLREAGVDVSEDQQRRLFEDIQRGIPLEAALGRSDINLSDQLRTEVEDLAREFDRDIGDIRRRQVFAQQDAQVRQQRAQADLQQRAAERRQDIEAQATATATAIEMALVPLLDMQSDAGFNQAVVELGTAATEQTTAAMEQITAATQQKEAAIELTSAARVSGLTNAAAALTTASGVLGEVAGQLQSAARSLTDLPSVLRNISGGWWRFYKRLTYTSTNPSPCVASNTRKPRSR